MALHKQESNKPKKQYPNNFTLYPGVNDKLLIWYNKELKAWKVTHYSKWAFRGQYSFHGTRVGTQGTPGFMVRRNEWTYTGKGKDFKNEIEALEFAKSKAAERNFENPIFLLQMEP